MWRAPDFGRIFKAAGLYLPDAELQRMFRRLDSLSTGELDRRTFEDAFYPVNPGTCQRVPVRAVYSFRKLAARG